MAKTKTTKSRYPSHCTHYSSEDSNKMTIIYDIYSATTKGNTNKDLNDSGFTSRESSTPRFEVVPYQSLLW